MDKREFCNEMIRQIMEILPAEERDGLDLQLQTIVKVNDQELNGLIFKRDDNNAAPTIYLDDAYEDHERGASIRSIADNIVSVYMDCKDMQPAQKNIESLDLSYDNIRDKITMRLVEIKRNRQFLQDRPYMNVGNGLAVICDIQVEGPGGTGVISINNDLVKQNGYDRRLLFENAMEDAWHNAPPTLYDMQQSLFGGAGENLLADGASIDQTDKAMMYVLSNREYQFGAVSMFYPDIQKRISDTLQEGYYALPSSLHEYLIIPESAGVDVKELTEMVRSANRNEGVVSPKDVLSDQVLHYDMNTRMLDAVAEPGMREAQRMEAR